MFYRWLEEMMNSWRLRLLTWYALSASTIYITSYFVLLIQALIALLLQYYTIHAATVKILRSNFLPTDNKVDGKKICMCEIYTDEIFIHWLLCWTYISWRQRGHKKDINGHCVQFSVCVNLKMDLSLRQLICPAQYYQCLPVFIKPKNIS